MTPMLDSIIYSTVFGNGLGISISPTAFLVDLCNKIYLSGWGGSTNAFNTCNNANTTDGMPVTSDAFQATTDGGDHYVMVLEDDASALVYGSFFGGPSAQNMWMEGQAGLTEKVRCIRPCVQDEGVQICRLIGRSCFSDQQQYQL